VCPTALRFLKHFDPFDHVIGRQLLELGAMALDLLGKRLAVAIHCQGLPSLGVTPVRQGGLDGLSL
jgi:hypothetical protein